MRRGAAAGCLDSGQYGLLILRERHHVNRRGRKIDHGEQIVFPPIDKFGQQLAGYGPFGLLRAAAHILAGKILVHAATPV